MKVADKIYTAIESTRTKMHVQVTAIPNSYQNFFLSLTMCRVGTEEIFLKENLFEDPFSQWLLLDS